MRRTVIGAACALVLSMVSAHALAVDIEPYVHYEVTKEGAPDEFYTDLNVAAALQVANKCERYGYADCKVKKIALFGSIYITDYDYINDGGGHAVGSVDGYRYFACDNPPSRREYGHRLSS